MQSQKRKCCVRATILFGVLIAAGFLATRTPAQNNAQERAANLRAQLVEAQARQAELQTRLQQLEEDLKPENIERSLAGVGSTHPEDLREARRRQLEIEKRGVQSQLDVLAASRTRLEGAIATADAESYRQTSGMGPNLAQVQPNNTTLNASSKITPTKKHRPKRRKPRS